MHDGVAIAIRRDIHFRPIPGLSAETLAVSLELAHEEVVVATCYCPSRRTAIPINDIINLLRITKPIFIIGDFNINSTTLQDRQTNKFGKQHNVLHRTGKIIRR